MKKIFYSLGLENICDEVIETLIYTKILNPQFNFDMSDIEKLLDAICNKREEIKSILKKYEIPSSLSYVRKIFKTIEDRESYYLVCLYIRTKLTDTLHEKFGFRTDYEILEYSYLKGLFCTAPKILDTRLEVQFFYE